MSEYTQTERTRVKRGAKRANYDKETVNAILDEHVTMTQAMAFSAFKGPFEERIDNWNTSLQMISEVIDEWIALQRNWLTLTPRTLTLTLRTLSLTLTPTQTPTPTPGYTCNPSSTPKTSTSSCLRRENASPTLISTGDRR